MGGVKGKVVGNMWGLKLTRKLTFPRTNDFWNAGTVCCSCKITEPVFSLH